MLDSNEQDTAAPVVWRDVTIAYPQDEPLPPSSRHRPNLDPDVRLNREVIRDWIARRYHHETYRPYPVHLCEHCHLAPVSDMPWRPWHPAFALLCANCRSRWIIAAERAMERTHASFESTLNTILHALGLIEPS